MQTKFSWKTTLGGILLGAGAFAHASFPNLPWIGDALLGIGGILLGTSARDNNVSSEQAGIK